MNKKNELLNTDLYKNKEALKHAVHLKTIGYKPEGVILRQFCTKNGISLPKLMNGDYDELQKGNRYNCD